MILIETQFLPPISFFTFYVKESTIFIEAEENYQKKGLRNKAYVMGPDRVETLIVPLRKGKNAQKPIREVEITGEMSWRRVMCRKIMSVYGKSPYFDYLFSEFEHIINKKHQFLFDLNLELLHWIINFWGWDDKIELTKQYGGPPDATIIDLRNRYTKDFHKRSKEKYIPYPQVFEDRHGFVPHLSVLDLMMCMGPESIPYMTFSKE